MGASRFGPRARCRIRNSLSDPTPIGQIGKLFPDAPGRSEGGGLPLSAREEIVRTTG